MGKRESHLQNTSETSGHARPEVFRSLPRSVTMSNKTTAYPELNASPRLIEGHLNKAFETASFQQICGAIGETVRAQNVSELALKSGIERAHLYHGFGSQRGPRLSTVIRVLAAMGVQLVARPNHPICRQRHPAPIGSKDLPELRSRPTSIASHLNKAFDTSDLRTICEAFSRVIRAQENVAEFARQAEIERTRLYRSFNGHRTPEFTTILSLLGALGLSLSVKRKSRPAFRSPAYAPRAPAENHAPVRKERARPYDLVLAR